MAKQISLILIDDHPAVRKGIKNLLESAGDISVDGEGENGADAMELVTEIKPDIVLLDVELPDKRGDKVMRDILAELPETKVLAVSAYHDRQYVRSMLDNGASGYITKDEVPGTLVKAIRTIINEGKNFSSPKVQDKDPLSTYSSSEPTLTLEEINILKWVIQDKSETVIADELKIDEKLVSRYLRLMMGKYGVDSLSDLKAIGRKYFTDHKSE